MRKGPNISKRADGRYEARYIKSRTDEGKIIYGFCYGKTYEEALSKRNAILGVDASKDLSVKHMNLLILGAGGYGHTVKEIAETIGVFENITFLDDDTKHSESIDICENFYKYKAEYPCAFPAFGDCKLRKYWLDNLENNGFIVPRMIHPSAMISPSAVIDNGVIVEANVTINAMTEIKKAQLLVQMRSLTVVQRLWNASTLIAQAQ